MRDLDTQRTKTRADEQPQGYKLQEGEAMNDLKKLQADYKAGKLTKAQYEEAVKELLDDEEIDQEQHDEALEYDPADDEGGDKPIYTQADMDRVVVKKARQLVKQQLKNAGVELEGVKPKDLLAKVVELVQAGTTAAENEGDLQKEVQQLRAKAAKLDETSSSLKAAVVENAVLKSAGKYSPVSPAQVVRALNADYKDLLEYDEDSGALIPKSVDKALKRIKEAEPNLFQNTPDEGGGEPGTDDSGNFQGKPPGGGSGNSKDADKLAAKKKEALELMGVKSN